MNCTSLVRDSARCGGHGYLCLPQDFCICDAGWSSVGDYPIVEGVNCNINKTAIRVLCSVDVVQASIFIMMILRYLSVRIFDKNSPRIVDLEPKALVPIFFLLLGISDFLIAFLKIKDDEFQLIGRDISISVCGTLYSLSVFISLTLYYDVILKFLKGYSRLMSVESRERVMVRFTSLRLCSYFILLCCFPVSLSCILAPIYKKYMAAWCRLMVVGAGVLVSVYGVLFLIALGFLLHELKGSMKSLASSNSGIDDISMVCKRLQLAYHYGGFLIVGGAGMMILFGSLDYLFTKSSYILILVRLTGVQLFGILIITLSKITPKPQSVASSTFDLHGPIIRVLSKHASLSFPSSHHAIIIDPVVGVDMEKISPTPVLSDCGYDIDVPTTEYLHFEPCQSHKPSRMI